MCGSQGFFGYIAEKASPGQSLALPEARHPIMKGVTPSATSIVTVKPPQLLQV
jgi:hypothetical protein